MPHINVDVVGHSFVKAVEEFGVKQGRENLGLKYEKVSVNFRSKQGAVKMLKILDVATFSSRYEVDPWSVPDFTFILSGTNDIQDYLRDSHNLMDNDEMMGGVLALQLIAVVDRMKQAGVPLVLVGGALPRTGGGKYGAAAFLEEPTGAEMVLCQERSFTLTAAFNQKLISELWVRQGVEYCKMKGLNENWECNIVDGVHLGKGTPMLKLFTAIRTPIIVNSKKF